MIGWIYVWSRPGACWYFWKYWKGWDIWRYRICGAVAGCVYSFEQSKRVTAVTGWSRHVECSVSYLSSPCFIGPSDILWNGLSFDVSSFFFVVAPPRPGRFNPQRVHPKMCAVQDPCCWIAGLFCWCSSSKNPFSHTCDHSTDAMTPYPKRMASILGALFFLGYLLCFGLNFRTHLIIMVFLIISINHFFVVLLLCFLGCLIRATFSQCSVVCVSAPGCFGDVFSKLFSQKFCSKSVSPTISCRDLLFAVCVLGAFFKKFRSSSKDPFSQTCDHSTDTMTPYPQRMASILGALFFLGGICFVLV